MADTGTRPHTGDTVEIYGVKWSRWAAALSGRLDIIISIIIAFAITAAFHLHFMLLAGDWDFWVDWKDRQYWVTLMPIVAITFPAALQYVMWERFRLPIGATLSITLLMIGAWIARYFGFHIWSYFPISLVWPTLMIPGAIVLDCALLLQAMAGHDAADSHSLDLLVPDYAEASARVSALRIGLPRSHFFTEVAPEVLAAVATARRAGIRVVMVTGDHPATAAAIARAIGIDDPHVMTGQELDASSAGPRAIPAHVNVFARVRPEQKLQLVEVLQASGHIVAMTGDGINDAAAVKRAEDRKSTRLNSSH